MFRSIFRQAGRKSLLALAISLSTAPLWAQGTAPATKGFKIKMTTLALCNEPIAWGIEEGIYAKHGIDLELVRVNSGAAGIAALQSGEINVAFVNSLSAIRAIESGVKAKIVSGATLSTPKSNAVVVRADSPIKEAKDLQGQKVTVNQLGGLGHFVTEAWIARAAGGRSTAQFVTLPFPDQIPAVESGAVVAAQVTAPQADAAASAGRVKLLGNPFYDLVGSIPTVVYIAMDNFIEKNQDVMSRFATAMTEVADKANDPTHKARRLAVTAANCKSTPEDIAKTEEPVYEGKVTMGHYRNLVTLLQPFGQAKKIDIERAIPAFARLK